MRAAAKELAKVAGQSNRWVELAWSDIKLRYRRTLLGPLWITLGLGATILSVGILYGILFNNPLSFFLPYFASGLIVWTFVSACMTEGCYVFMAAASVLKAVPAPLSIHVYRTHLRQLITLAHNFLLIPPLWFVFQWPLGWETLLIVPGLMIVALFGLGVMLTLSIVGARYRDVPLLVATALQLLFLLTPILWAVEGERGSLLSLFAMLNPFFHLLEVVRSPILGHAPSLLNWTAACVVSSATLGLGVYFYARYRHRIAFWV